VFLSSGPAPVCVAALAFTAAMRVNYRFSGCAFTLLTSFRKAMACKPLLERWMKRTFGHIMSPASGGEEMHEN